MTTPNRRKTDVELLTEDQAAALLTVTAWRLGEWRRAGKGPPYVRIGRSIRYRPSDIAAWLDGKVVLPGLDG